MVLIRPTAAVILSLSLPARLCRSTAEADPRTIPEVLLSGAAGEQRQCLTATSELDSNPKPSRRAFGRVPSLSPE